MERLLVFLRAKSCYLAFRAIAKRPMQRVTIIATPPVSRRPQRVWRPSMAHPYKAASYQAMLRKQAARAETPQHSNNSHSRAGALNGINTSPQDAL